MTTLIQRITNAAGVIAMMSLLFIVVLESVVVILRYGFEFGSIALQESVTYLHACAFLLAACYTLRADEHVRVDIFYRNFSEKRKALTNLVGTLVFLLPVCGFIVWSSLDYVGQSWTIKEISADAGGLPGVFLLKTLIPLFAVLLALQGIDEIIRSLQIMRGTPVSNKENN